jgi:hypothetical protein
MEAYNKDKLIKIEVVQESMSMYYIYKKEYRHWFWKNRKEGFYTLLFDDYIGLDVPKNHVFKNMAAYEKPKVIFYFQEGHRIVKYFNSHSEAIIYANNTIKECGDWII